MSPYAQQKKGFTVQALCEQNACGHWEDLAVEDRHATPADVATFRVDFRDWLQRLKRLKRQLALRLAAGETTTDAAEHFRVSPSRISQLRQELQAHWDAFQASPIAMSAAMAS